ncbi:MAG: DoxX family protein [Lacunisphaera sp.]|nr:DoxX family protein [Lacunisphaera sp.]
MEPTTPAAPVSKAARWTGRILSTIPVLMLLFSGAMKFIPSPQLNEGFAHLGWPIGRAPVLAILELGCAIIYLIPRTSVLGAILLTGYMGGAIATHVRIGEAVYLHVVFGVMLWGGLYLRDPRLRALIPLRA